MSDGRAANAERAERADAPAPPAGDAPLQARLSGSLRAFEALLRANPNGIGFFQAVRLLERLHPERAPVGGWSDPAAEVARFTVPTSIAFPASEIQSLDLDAAGPARMAVNFMGLGGPQGVLPHVYTLYADERARARDPALRDFLDLFNHRIISYFYRAWAKYRFTGTIAPPGRDPLDPDQRDHLAGHLADLIGIGTRGLLGRLAVRDESLLFYSGLLAPHRRSAAALEQLLTDYFGVHVAVEQFVGSWYPIARGDQCALDDEAASPSAQLGLGAVAGDEIWDQQARVSGPSRTRTRAQYDDFLPGGIRAERAAAGLGDLAPHRRSHGPRPRRHRARALTRRGAMARAARSTSSRGCLHDREPQVPHREAQPRDASRRRGGRRPVPLAHALRRGGRAA